MEVKNSYPQAPFYIFAILVVILGFGLIALAGSWSAQDLAKADEIRETINEGIRHLNETNRATEENRAFWQTWRHKIGDQISPYVFLSLKLILDMVLACLALLTLLLLSYVVSQINTRITEGVNAWKMIDIIKLDDGQIALPEKFANYTLLDMETGRRLAPGKQTPADKARTQLSALDRILAALKHMGGREAEKWIGTALQANATYHPEITPKNEDIKRPLN